MRYAFPYDWLGPLEIPDQNLVGVFQAKRIADTKSEEEVIKEGFERPIGTPCIREMARGKTNVLILSDDNSRRTPVYRVIPYLMAELREAGIVEENIRFLFALATHRDMTPDEMIAKLGPAVAGKHETLNHHGDNPDETVRLGTSALGTDVWVNKELRNADLIIGVGGIVPHPAAGFSGGGKIVAPGVCNAVTTGLFHWRSVSYPQREILGRRENPIRQMIDDIARTAGLDIIVNMVQDGTGRIVKVVVGDFVEAHRAGCVFAREIFGVNVPSDIDIIIADSHPADIEMWQAVKGLCALEVTAPDHAVLIYVSPCPEGMSVMHPEMSRYGFQTYEQAKALLDGGNVDMVVAHQMVQVGRLLKRTKCFLISLGITEREEIERVGFAYARTVEEALDRAFQIKGSSAKVAVLRHGGEVIPLVKEA